MSIEAVNIKNISQVKDTFRISLRTLKLIWGVDPLLFIGEFLATVIPAVVPFVNIYIYKLIIDMVIQITTTGSSDYSGLYPLIGMRIVTYFIQDASFMTQAYIDRLLFTKVPIYINQLYLSKLSKLDVHYFEDSNFRDLMERARESFDYRPQNLTRNLFYTFQSLVQFLIAFVALVNLNWLFTILIFAVTLPEFINQTIQSKISWGIWSHNSPFRKRYDYLLHLLQGHREFKEVKLFSLAQKILEEIKKIQEKFYVDNKKVLKRGYFTGLGLNIFSALVFIGIEAFVIMQALTKKVTIGDIGFYTGVVGNFQNGLGGLFRNVAQVFEDSLYVKSVFEIIDAEPIIKQIDDPIKLNLKKSPRIEFKNVDFSYAGSDTKILNQFSLIIESGEKVAFVGENGAGKTTIIKLLARFYDVDRGEILINEINIKNLDLEQWHKNLGVLFQDFNKYEHTVKENIYFGKIHEPLDIKKIIEAGVSSGADPMVQKFDRGYEQILGKIFEGGIELSGGQWQKIALSRAFFRDAPILVLDEPTASIDAKSEAEIFNKVEKLSKDKTVIIISHRFSTVRNADKIYVIDQGKIVESGSHGELIKQKGQYATLFNLQAKAYQ